MIDHPYLNQLRQKKIHLVGLSSAEISAVAEFLHVQGVKNMVAHDIKDGVEFKQSFRRAHQGLTRAQQVSALKKIEALPLERRFGKKSLQGIAEAQVVFPTQGWFLYPESKDKLSELLSQGMEFGSMTKLYLQLSPATVIGVTGTNGKGTTTHLVAAMLKKSGRKVYLAGNDPESIQALDQLEKMKENEYLVLEISNRQLMIDLGKSPKVAVITNVTPNHLNEHRHLFDEYARTKQSLLKYQAAGDYTVLNFDNETTAQFATKAKARVCGFSTFKNLRDGVCLIKDKIVSSCDGRSDEVLSASEVKLPGRYNLENVLAAVAVAKICQVDNQSIKQAVASFKGMPHRLEFIREFKGVRYYNDLFSTTPASTQLAIESFDRPVILIAGGDAKGVDYFSLAEAIKHRVKKLWLFPGTVAEDLKKHFQKIHFGNFVETDDFDKCLEEVAASAADRDLVLLSPGGAYFSSKFIEKKSKGFDALVRSW